MNATTMKMSNDEYHNSPRIGNSMLSVAIKNPAKFDAYYVSKTCSPPVYEQYIVGTIAHGILLEEKSDCTIIPPEVLTKDGKRYGKAWDAFEADNFGKQLVTTAQYGLGVAVAQAVYANGDAKRLLGLEGVREQAIFWNDDDTGLQLKCKPDSFAVLPSGEYIIIDFKTTVAADPEAFAASILRYGYHRQAAFYSLGVQALTGEWPSFAFIAAEKEPPYTCAVYDLDEDFLSRGIAEVRAGLARLAQRLQDNDWQPEWAKGIKTLSAPRWAKYDDYEVTD